jgi:hypothetical protein
MRLLPSSYFSQFFTNSHLDLSYAKQTSYDAEFIKSIKGYIRNNTYRPTIKSISLSSGKTKITGKFSNFEKDNRTKCTVPPYFYDK